MIRRSNYALLIFSIKLVINFTSSQKVSCKLPNVGTVLFTKRDFRRLDCWSQEEAALLYSRRIFQELLPKQIPHNVPHILDYFKLCFYTMKDVVGSEYTFSMMLVALSDVFGGFLKAYGLPLLNEAYYEGYVGYKNAKKLYDVQHDFLKVLRTDGEQWVQRMEIKRQINKVMPLTLTKSTDDQVCSKIITDDKISHFKKRQLEMKFDKDNFTTPFIPLPLLDNSRKPSTIAVPLKEHSLYSLQHQCSYDILVTYYKTASDCIVELTKEGTRVMDQTTFDQMFYTWLKNNVLPHLTDSTWYVGFSNVLRIEATIRQKEGTLGIMQVQSIHDESKIDNIMNALDEEENISTTSYLLIIAILILSLFIACFLYWTFFRHFLCCCTTIKCDVEGSQNSCSCSSSASLLTSETTSKTSSSDQSHSNNERLSKNISKSDSKLGSPKSNTEMNQYNSMPTLETIDEKEYFSKENRSYNRKRSSTSTNKKKRGKHNKN